MLVFSIYCFITASAQSLVLPAACLQRICALSHTYSHTHTRLHAYIQLVWPAANCFPSQTLSDRPNKGSNVRTSNPLTAAYRPTWRMSNPPSGSRVTTLTHFHIQYIYTYTPLTTAVAMFFNTAATCKHIHITFQLCMHTHIRTHFQLFVSFYGHPSPHAILIVSKFTFTTAHFRWHK